MAAGRPLEFDPDRALDAAVEVFWSRGYEAASMADLVQAMGISRSSLYQAFGGKRLLFERCLERYRERQAALLAERLAHAASGRRFLEEVFRSVAATAAQPAGLRGCLIGNSTIEIGGREPELAEAVALGLRRFEGVFKAAVKRGQAEGDIASPAPPAALAACLMASMTGLRALIKNGLDEPAARRLVPLILRALD